MKNEKNLSYIKNGLTSVNFQFLIKKLFHEYVGFNFEIENPIYVLFRK